MLDVLGLMSKDVSWAHVVRQISNLDIVFYVYTVYNEWMSVCLGELRILSFTPRSDNMDGV